MVDLTRRHFAQAAAAAALGGASVDVSIVVGAPRTDRGLGVLRLVNNTGTSWAAGNHSPVLGWVFKRGDVPKGTAPHFQVSGVDQPYSWGLRTYWSDGSLKFASFLLRLTGAVAPKKTILISVLGGGTAPARSMRTLAEVYAQNLMFSATAAPVQYSIDKGLTSGTFVAWLKDDANILRARQWLDGDAGAAWCIDTRMATSQDGADKWLQVSHYIVALTDASGGLAGFRYHAAIRQPVYNSGTTSYPRMFDGTTIGFSLNGGPQVKVPWPFTPTIFKVDGKGVVTTAAKNPFWCGAQSNGNIIPCYISRISGASPLAPFTKQPTYVSQYVNNGVPKSNTLLFYRNSSGGYAFGTSDDSSNNIPDPWSGNPLIGNPGSGTINPMMVVQSFTRCNFANADGKYVFFQGTGSMQQDATLRAQIDQTHWQSTAVIPPFDLSLLGKIGDTGFFTPGYQNGYNLAWNPLNIGDLLQSQGNQGDHWDLGALPNDAAIDFFVQTHDSERLVRFIGLAAGLTTADLRDATTGTIAVLTSGSYSGMAQSVATSLEWGSGSPNAQGSPNSSVQFSQTLAEHRPQYSYWAYLRSGELQYLDLLTEQANLGVLALDHTANAQFSRNLKYNFFVPQFYGNVLGGMANPAEARVGAWAFRDIALAAGIYPRDATDPSYLPLDGSQTGQYLHDLMQASTACCVAMMNPANNAYGPATPYYTDPSRTIFLACDQVRAQLEPQGYMRHYQAFALCFAAAMAEDTYALQMLEYYANEMSYRFHRGGGGWVLHCYNFLEGLFTGNHMGPVGNFYANDDLWGVYFGVNTVGPLNFSAGTPRYEASGNLSNGVRCFSFGPLTPENAYTPANGDLFVFHNAIPINDFVTWKKPYYIVNYLNGRFNLTGLPGGQGLAVTVSGSVTDFHGQPRGSRPPLGSVSFPGDYVLIGNMAFCWMKAIFASKNLSAPLKQINPLVADAAFRIAKGPGILGNNTYSGQGARYAVQDYFAT